MAPGSDPQHKHFPPPPLPKRRTQDEAFIKDPQRKHLPLPPLPKRRNQDEVFIKEQPSKASPQPLSTASSRRLPLSSLPLTRRVSANVSEVDSLGHPIKLSTTKPPFKNDRSADFLIDRQAGCVDLGLIEPETYPKLDQPDISLTKPCFRCNVPEAPELMPGPEGPRSYCQPCALRWYGKTFQAAQAQTFNDFSLPLLPENSSQPQGPREDKRYTPLQELIARLNLTMKKADEQTPKDKTSREICKVDTDESSERLLEQVAPPMPVRETMPRREADCKAIPPEREQNLLTRPSTDHIFFSTLLSMKQAYATKAANDFIDFAETSHTRHANPNADSTTSSSASQDAPAPSTSSTLNSGPSAVSKGKRKIFDSDGRSSEDPDDNDDDNKRQKASEESVASVDPRRLSCPFRKFSPSIHGLHNLRYQSCATGSWKDISHVKDSHIYRVHLAQCCGCKAPMKTRLAFAEHKRRKTSSNPLTKCNNFRGLFEEDVAALKQLKMKGQGKIASWEIVYTFLFPESENIPSPWFVPPCDHQCDTLDDQELNRMMPGEIAAFMESQFMALYDKISSKKTKILELLVDRLQKRHSEEPSKDSTTSAEVPLNQPPSTTYNAEGQSAWQWDHVMLDANAGDSGIDLWSSTNLADFNFNIDRPVPVGILPQVGDFRSDEWHEQHAKQSESYEAGWNDGHEKGYLDGQREGYKAGKNAALQGRQSASNRPNSFSTRASGAISRQSR